MGRGKRRDQTAPYLQGMLARDLKSTTSSTTKSIPLTASPNRNRRAPVGLSFAAVEPDESIMVQARLLRQEILRGDWDEAALVLWRYRADLEMTAERPFIPKALHLLRNSCMEEASYDGTEHIEGQARRFFQLTGAIPWKSPVVVRSGAPDGEQVALLHLRDPAQSTQTVCQTIKRISSSQAVARGHFEACYPEGVVANHRVCKICARHADTIDGALEESYFRVLERNDEFPPPRVTEWMDAIGSLFDGLETALDRETAPTGTELREAMRSALASFLCELAARRLAALEWEESRKRFFAIDLRLGAFYRAAYGRNGERAQAPTLAAWRQVLTTDLTSLVLPEIYDSAGTIVDHTDWKQRCADLDEHVVVPGLLAHCFPEMLDLIERELEGPPRLLKGLSDDFYDRLTKRLDGVWQRADRRRIA
jgi:hypothetical protein